VGSVKSRGWVAALAVVTLAVACTDGGPRAGSESPRSLAEAPETPADGGYELSRQASKLARSIGVDIGDLVAKTRSIVDPALPGALGDVYVDVDPDKVIPRFGVGGYTSSSGGTVFFYLNPGQAHLASTLEARLPPMLAHELDHSVRFSEGPGTPGNLLESMISEGIADHFANEVLALEKPLPWEHALTASQEHRLWIRAQPLLDRIGPPSLLKKWIFGGGDVPHWTGYSLGGAIVTAYLDAHPDATAADLTLLDAEEILDGSDYSP
jgi:predicted Zn-dependent protease DUF2268